jgi:hypothetical protein
LPGLNIDFYNENRNKPGVEDRKITEREGEEGEGEESTSNNNDKET